MIFGTADIPLSIVRKILHLWKKKQLIVGCYGSRKKGTGSFAWDFFDWTSPQQPILPSSVPLHGDSEQSTPLRSEFFGICACLCQIYTMSNKNIF